MFDGDGTSSCSCRWLHPLFPASVATHSFSVGMIGRAGSAGGSAPADDMASRARVRTGAEEEKCVARGAHRRPFFSLSLMRGAELKNRMMLAAPFNG
jgi:hypothetical protein